MKKSILFSFCLLTIFASGQMPSFKNVVSITSGDVEDQCATGTCWSFATVSFFESEMIRKGHESVDLSEMFNVYYTYPEKAKSYIRFQGKQQFSEGGLAHDALQVLEDHGIMPESAYSGLPTAASKHNHQAMDAMLAGLVKSTLEKQLYKTDINWVSDIQAILNNNLGIPPSTFDYKGKKYTPQSFRDSMDLHASDYISLTSFTHHPWYRPFVLEVPDNWSKGSFYNLPLDELEKTVDYALEHGYTIAWDADVSEASFRFNEGVAFWPNQLKGDQKPSWFDPEANVTSAERQLQYERGETTDDHLMHIVGIAKDNQGKKCYIVKNSWGKSNLYGGLMYVSPAYFKMKTVSLMLHQSSIPAEISRKFIKA
jgi:bleomycin hydrolase